MRSFQNFSDHDFELFVADLLGAERNVRYETFPRGPDQGVDLRSLVPDTGPDVVQCKHYLRSSFATLKRAAKAEAKRLARLEPAPGRYTFVTSAALAKHQKGQLAAELQPWIATETDILGANDLEGLLDNHPAVERRQVKLWLTGGTQLAALLRAGSIRRSSALLREITDALPRYVQGAAFEQAREQLRDRHVLVIAGVPGIGKTTLARILLADAVLDGYEPFEVSNDIEEAWNLLDDTKQIFLYDDFLGRTALSDRFAKNEDRRLLDFMALAAKRPDTLFVLTTREHILQQAAQLYERIEHSAVGERRFLLELPDYSLLDRARIFANHIFHSPDITPAIRKALHKDRSYARIVEHDNYNPRIIEWITGMGGRQLDNDQVANYLSFALDALDHPDRIWKHAFQHEIDDHGRVLLMALATLPRHIDVDRLEVAFDALCGQCGLSTRDQAFRRALSALDDSLIRTRQGLDDVLLTPAGIVVNPYDPSVVDYIADYLTASPQDARDLIRSAVFFEQVIWLWNHATNKQQASPADRLQDLSDALQRTFFAPGLTTVTVPVSNNAWTVRPTGAVDHESRLLEILALIPHAGAQQEALRGWWRRTFEERVEAWRTGQGEPPSLLALLAELKRVDTIDLAVPADAAKGVLAAGYALVQNAEWHHELRSLVPGAFADGEWEALRDELAQWLEEDLVREAQDMHNTDELYYVERIADLIGIVIDDAIWEEAHDIVRERADAREEPDDDDGYRRAPRRDPIAEAREVEAIFARLAEGG